MSSWAEDADNNTAISNDTFSAEKILSQSEDGRKIIKEITEFKIVNEKSVKIIRKISVQTKTVRINKNVKARRGWAKYGDCEGQAAGFKEQGVVNIDENQPFELAGQEETVAPTQKGVGNLLNMDTFSILRQLRTRMTSGEITQEQYDQERARILKKDAPTRSGDAEADVERNALRERQVEKKVINRNRWVEDLVVTVENKQEKSVQHRLYKAQKRGVEKKRRQQFAETQAAWQKDAAPQNQTKQRERHRRPCWAHGGF
jgi:hypothetical protein